LNSPTITDRGHQPRRPTTPQQYGSASPHEASVNTSPRYQQVAEFLTRHRTVHAARLKAYQDERTAAETAGATPRDLITLDFGLRYETAVLDWFSNLPDDLTHPTADLARVHR
jgi:hypothetical protein